MRQLHRVLKAMRKPSRRFLALGLAILGLSACGQPTGTSPPGQEGAIAPPAYHTQQRPLIPRVGPWSRFSGFRPAVEQELVDLASGGRSRGGLPALYASPTTREIARAQSARMAALGEARLTADHLAQLRLAVSPLAMSGDFWVFVNQVAPTGATSVAQALVTQGPRPMVSYNLYALKPNFDTVGVGVYRSGDSYYATVIAYRMTGGVTTR